MATIRSRPGRPLACDKASAISAMIPPSPRLSARITKPTYLIETTMINDHRISDRIPSTCSGVGVIGWCPANTSFIVYSGLVPMSP